VDATESAAAQALFDEAKQLMAEGKADTACPRLEESLRLDPAIGTRYQLARCYELMGRFASAWTFYLEVAAEARTLQQPEREEFARSEARKLEARLSYLTLEVPHQARVEGLQVKRNGVTMGKGQWGTRLPVDPGRHTLEVSAPDRQPWRVELDVPGPSGAETVVVPTLDFAGSGPSATTQSTAKDSAASPASPAVWTPRRWAGLITLGVGVLGLGLGSWFSLQARNEDQDSNCNPQCASQADLDTNQDARRHGNMATVAGLAGAALLGTGAVLFLAAPDSQTAAVKAQLSAGGTRLELMGHF
jgi:hypothetical protein